MKTGGFRVLRDAGLAQRLRQDLANPPEQATAWMESHTHILKEDAHSRVGLLPLAGVTRYLKLYLGKSRWQRLGFRLGRGRGVNAFDAAQALQASGIAVPSPGACVYVPEGMLLLTEAISGHDLKALFQSGWDDATARQLMVSAGLALGELHRAGFAHGDCKWSNLLWSGERFYLADLEAVRRAPAGSTAGLRDLARFTLNGEDLALSPDLYQVFLASYLHTTGQKREAVESQTLPILNELRARHAARYGGRGHRLLGAR
jgi:tRNA A-37 threonylcarbamoyl transferase component Bud32